jgi:hypothetical protein
VYIEGVDVRERHTERETRMLRIDTPVPAAYTVKVHTSLPKTYMRAFHALLSDPDRPISGDHWIQPTRRSRGVERIEIAEAESGRGLVFTFQGGPERAMKIVAQMLAEAEAEFDERERSLLANESVVGTETVRRDAESGF